jgi:hypothetical protein
MALKEALAFQIAELRSALDVQFNVTGSTGTVSTVSVSFGAAHPWVGDLKLPQLWRREIGRLRAYLHARVFLWWRGSICHLALWA